MIKKQSHARVENKKPKTKVEIESADKNKSEGGEEKKRMS